jgi:hypothetical protein
MDTVRYARIDTEEKRRNRLIEGVFGGVKP